MSNKALVSVIIPTYNRANIVTEAIDSVLKQTYPHVQLIVVDDGSQDNTEELLKDYEGIEYIWQPNKGQAAARNKGLEHSKGTIITSLDSDDTWESTFLEKCVAKLEEDHLDFVFANWIQDTPHEGKYAFVQNYDPLKPYLNREKDSWINLTYPEVRELYIGSCPSPTSSLVFRRASMPGGWVDKMYADDWCLLLNIILSKECKIAFTTEVLWHKKLDGMNIYEGRDELELLRVLNIEVVGIFLKQFAPLMNKKELNVLQKIHIEGLVNISKHTLFQEHNSKKALYMFGKSIAIGPFHTLKISHELFSNGFERHFNILTSKFKSLLKKSIPK